MRIGLYPFASTANIGSNLQIMDKAAAAASDAAVRLLVFHECALCGYPPIESEIEAIHPDAVELAIHHLADTAKRNGLYLAFGTVRFEGKTRYNSIILLDDHGDTVGHYDKQAIWGWDTDHFARGTAPGVFRIDDVNIGFRICFDIRFPEPFRQLRRQNADLCIVCFSDVGDQPDPQRYQLIRSHLMTRAVENVMTVASVNSISKHQTAPTAIIHPAGTVLMEAAPNQEQLMIFDYEPSSPGFGMKGILHNSVYFMGEAPD